MSFLLKMQKACKLTSRTVNTVMKVAATSMRPFVKRYTKGPQNKGMWAVMVCYSDDIPLYDDNVSLVSLIL